MSRFTKYLIEFVAGQFANGAVNGGPLSAPIVAGNEGGVVNKKATPVKLIKFDDPPYANTTNPYDDSDEFDSHDNDDNDGTEEQLTDDEVKELFSQFKQWLQQKDLFPEEDEEPEVLDPENVEGMDDEQLDDFDMDEDMVNPDRQGMIRVVADAHLVYKREQPDGFYEELWIYNIGKDVASDNIKIKQNILAGTDIPNNSTQSEDGTQSYTLWTCGNAQLLKITGLPN